MVQIVNVPVAEPERPGETAPRRNAKLKDLTAIKRPVGYKANTVYEFILEAFNKGGDRNAIGHRDILEVHKEKKMVKKMVDGEEVEVEKTWLFYELSDYKFETYKQVNKYIHSYGRGLIKLGLKPNGEHKLHIFASTSYKWMKTFLASQTQAIPVVTAYDTLGEKGLTVSLTQTESNAIFTDNNLLSELINPLKEAKDVKFIIHSEPIDPKDKRQDGELYQEAKTAVDKILEIRPDIKIVSLDDAYNLGKESSDIPANPPSPSDLSCIMYTSGSTGDPKGVVLTHENILAGVAGVSFIIDRSVVNEKDRILAFLPLAHIFELTFELIAFYWNGTIGYANVKTLTDNSTRNCSGDIKTFKPTIMVAVAAVWETIKKGIVAQIAKQPSLTQKIFWSCFNYKLKNWKVPGTSYLIDNFIFKKVKQATGGNLRLVLNGGSPISKDTQVFISNLICPMLIGYGLTETVANTTVLHPDNFEFDVQGSLSGSITVKLVDVADAGYYAKNDQGEIWIRGYPVTPEYYKNKKETEASFDPDGWFKTGDIGEWTKTGQLKIIDRKKNLVKTLNGEYIALEKLESVYRSNTYVQNICVYADQNHSKPLGIIVPNETAIKSLALEMNLIKSEEEDIHKAQHDPKLVNKVLKALLSTGRSQGLKGIELLEGIVLSEEEWTPQNGFVTSAQKLQRKKILEANKKAVDKVYSRS